VWGDEHPRMASNANTEALCLRALGQYDDAVEQLHKAVRIRRKVLGEMHPLMAGPCNNLALCLSEVGKSAEAWPWYDKALEITRKAFGEEHAQTATCYSNAAWCLLALGKPDDAIRHWEAALAGFDAGRLDSGGSGFDRAVYLSGSDIAPRAALAVTLARRG